MEKIASQLFHFATQRVVDGSCAMLGDPVLDEEVVDSLQDLSGAVEPPDADHQRVPLAPLELGYVADVERLVRPLTFDEDSVPDLVLHVGVLEPVSQELNCHVPPTLAL